MGSIKTGREEYWDRSDLRERGWSDTMIKRYLGNPDNVIKLGGGRRYYQWDRHRAEAAEQDEQWNIASAKFRRRSESGKKAAERRAQEVTAQAQKIVDTALRMKSTPLSWERLREKAIDHKATHYLEIGNVESDPHEAPDHVVERWCMNYLRHVNSTYDEVLATLHDTFRGQPGVTGLYEEIVRVRADELTAQVLADLKQAAKLGGEENTD